MTMPRARMNVFVFGLELCAIAFTFTQCDARTTHFIRGQSTKMIVITKHIDLYNAQKDDVYSETGSYGVGSPPFTIPPYDSLPPVSWPNQNTPPFCIDSPFMPLPPPSSSSNPTPIIPFPNPPLGPGSTVPSGPSTGPSPSNPGMGSSPSNPGTGSGPSGPNLNPPIIFPSPPIFTPSPSNPGTGSGPSGPNPNPPIIFSSPPIFTPSPSNPGTGSGPSGPNPNPPIIFPSPPILTPSPIEPGLSPPIIVLPRPPSNNPPPSIFLPSPPVFQPPVVYPPPAVPHPPRAVHNGALWCVAKPTVPDPIIQEAMNYACGSGGDCESIQPEGLCFQPDTLYAHSSYAFNSYWQRTKVAGGTCDFGGTAMLVTVDPSYDSCHFVFF